MICGKIECKKRRLGTFSMPFDAFFMKIHEFPMSTVGTPWVQIHFRKHACGIESSNSSSHKSYLY